MYMELTKRVDDPETEEMMQILDPIHYLDRLENIPKLVVIGSND